MQALYESTLRLQHVEEAFHDTSRRTPTRYEAESTDPRTNPECWKPKLPDPSGAFGQSALLIQGGIAQNLP